MHWPMRGGSNVGEFDDEFHIRRLGKPNFEPVGAAAAPQLHAVVSPEVGATTADLGSSEPHINRIVGVEVQNLLARNPETGALAEGGFADFDAVDGPEPELEPLAERCHARILPSGTRSGLMIFGGRLAPAIGYGGRPEITQGSRPSGGGDGGAR